MVQPTEWISNVTDWTNIYWKEADYQDLASIIELCEDKDTFLTLKACYPIEAMRRSWRYLSPFYQDQIRTWLIAIAEETAA